MTWRDVLYLEIYISRNWRGIRFLGWNFYGRQPKSRLDKKVLGTGFSNALLYYLILVRLGHRDIPIPIFLPSRLPIRRFNHRWAQWSIDQTNFAITSRKMTIFFLFSFSLSRQSLVLDLRFIDRFEERFCIIRVPFRFYYTCHHGWMNETVAFFFFYSSSIDEMRSTRNKENY